MIEFIKDIDWSLVLGALTLLTFGPLYLAPVSYDCFINDYGEERGPKLWFRFNLICGSIFLLSVAGIFIICLSK